MSSALENRAQIAAMLAEEGIDVTIRRVVAGTYDPTTGATAAGTTTNYTGRGRLGSYSDRMIDGNRIKVGDRRLTFQPADWGYIPRLGDVVTVPIGYAVVGPIQVRELGGVSFSYTAQLRGSASS